MAETNDKNQHPTGFNCPNCNFFIEVSLESLLYDSSHRCPGCHTNFTMDRNESQTALGFLQNLKGAQDNLDTTGE